jgi:hypothetical protein
MNAPHPYRLGGIPDGMSNAIVLGDDSASFPSFPSVDAQSDTFDNSIL